VFKGNTASIKGIFKPSVSFGKKVIQLTPYNQPVTVFAMGNSCIQPKRKYIPQPGTIKRKNRLKTRFLNKYKWQGTVKGKIQHLTRVADIKSAAQGSRRGLKNDSYSKKHSR